MRILALLLCLAACSGPTVEQPPPPPAPKEVAPPRIGLVLGGGGARGFAHVGVLRVLEQARIPVHLVVGTSVGSLIGALYADKRDTFALEWASFELDGNDLLDISILSAHMGPVRGDAIREFVKRQVKTERIEELPMPFIAVATDLRTGKRVLLDHGLVADAVRASVSIPGIFVPAVIEGRMLVDGGLVANLPADVARERGADIVIAVSIAEEVKPETVENLIGVVNQSLNIMMSQMAAAQQQNADVVVRPSIGDIGTLDFTQKRRCLEAGVAAGREALPAIRAALAKYYESRGGVVPAIWAEASP
jgi:NTE family protein